jgi:uncharacterized protein
MSFESSIPAVPAAPVPPVASSDKALMLLCHLSVFLSAPFLLPFIVWLVKRNEDGPVGAHAAEVLNFHLSYLIYSLCCIPLIFLGVGVALLIVIGIASIVLAIIGAVKASDGILYRYPLTIRMVT